MGSRTRMAGKPEMQGDANRKFQPNRTTQDSAHTPSPCGAPHLTSLGRQQMPLLGPFHMPGSELGARDPES